MRYKEDIDIVKQRLSALLEGAIVDRCCVSVSASRVGEDPTVFAVGEVNGDDPADVTDYWTNPERILARNVRRMQNSVFGGEALPQIWLNFGTSGHAMYFGADYSLSPATLWCRSVIKDWDDFELKFDPQNEFLLKQYEIARYLCENAKGQFFVSMPDNCGSLDALGHLRDSSEVLLDMLSEPDIISGAIKTLNAGWKKANDGFYDIIRECDGGSTHGWMNLWAQGKIAQLQCDMSVMFSPQMYEQFVLPELQEQIEGVDVAVYHFDGQEQIRHLDHLLSLKKLKMIQWTHVAGQPPVSAFIPTLQRIQAAGKGLILYIEPWEVEPLMTELSSKGLYLHTVAANQEECDKIVAQVAALTRD